nr:MAG TPA: hypothetical protein [Bacteriophage sp.]
MDGVIFEFKRGRTYSRDFILTNFNKNIDKILFTVCENENDKNYKLRKTYGNGISLVDIKIDEHSNEIKTFNILIEATDTDKMRVETEYPFDVVIYSGTEKIPIMNGILLLKGTSTKTCNE